MSFLYLKVSSHPIIRLHKGLLLNSRMITQLASQQLINPKTDCVKYETYGPTDLRYKCGPNLVQSVLRCTDEFVVTNKIWAIYLNWTPLITH